jgi:hypothetical protein
MKRAAAFLGAALITGLSTASNSATLSVSTDKLTYLVGETVTLTVVGDDEDYGLCECGIFGQLEYSGALVDNGTRNQLQLVGSYGKWTQGVLIQGDDGIHAFSWAFNQIASNIGAGVYDNDVLNLPAALSTVTLIAKSVGVVDVNWHTIVDSSGTWLDFFALPNAPGTSFVIVPEPATGVLLGLGLLGFGIRRRARA